MNTHHTHSHETESAHHRPEPSGPMDETFAGVPKDPVCGMTVSPGSAHRMEYGGLTYLFCSSGCREKFRAHPDQYVPGHRETVAARSAPSAESAGKPTAHARETHSDEAAGSCAVLAPPAGTVYTCPMHPEIRRSEAGSCPICGMALEPVQPAAQAESSPELRDMTRRFWVGAALAVPLLFLDMGSHLRALNLHHYVSPLASEWIQFVLGTPVVLWAGWPLLQRGWD